MNAPEAAAALASTSDVGRHVLRQTTAYAVLRSLSGLFTWGAFVLLSRILDQRSFGAFEIGMFYIGVGQLIGDGGLAASLVRRRGAVLASEYQTALTSVFALAAVLALALFVAAPSIGRANQLSNSEIWALRALSPLFLVPALRIVPYVKLERSVNFAAIGRIELYANLARHATAVGVATLKGGVWALALSQLALALTQLLLAYRAEPGFVGFGWRRQAFSALYAYGGKIQLSVLLIHLKDNLAAGLLGPILGPSAVGVFRFALEFVRVPADIAGSLARIQFPVYAQHERGSPELLRVLRGALRAAFLVGLPVLGVLALGAVWVVPAIYGAKWLVALPVIAALVPHVAADLLVFHLITFIQGRGRAGLALLVYLLWSASLWLASGVALATAPGSLAAVALGHGAASTLTVAALLVWASRYLRAPLYRGLISPLLAALLAFAVAVLARSQLPEVAWLRASASLVLFLLGYAGSLLAFERDGVIREVRAAISTLRS